MTIRFAAKTSLARSGFMLMAGIAPFAATSAFAASCPDITADTTAAQTLSSGICTVEPGITLSVAGSTAGVTMSGGSIAAPTTLINNGSVLQTGSGRALQSAGSNAVLVIQNGLGATISSANNDTVAAGTGSTSVSSVSLSNAGTIQSFGAGAGQAVNFNKILSGANSVTNSGSILANGSDAVRTGVNGIVLNSGKIMSTQVGLSGGTDGIDAQNNTGAQITNNSGGLIEGGRHGITGGAANSTVAFTTSVTNNLGGVIQGDNGSGINLDGFNANQTAVIVNHGTITGNGVNGDGDGIDVDGVVNITNTGMVKSLNSFSSTTPAQSEGITVGGGTIINSGTIEGDVAAGNSNAVGRGITLAGIDSSGAPAAIYANSVVTNQNGGIIKGQSDSGIAVDGPASGFTVTINNNAGARIIGGGTVNAAIRTAGDNDTISNAGIIDGSSSGKAIDMGGGNNTLNIIGGSASIIGSINGGSGGANALTMNLGSGGAFAYSGSISNFNSVELQSGNATLSGVSTYAGKTVVSGGTLNLDGANRLAASSALGLNGGTLRLMNAGGANGQTFSSLSLTDNSTLDLGLSSLTFFALAAVGDGKTLTVTDYSSDTSPGYAFRFVGDDSTNAAFQTLIADTTIDGAAATYRFDGVYTDVAPVPLPASIWMLISGIGFVGVLSRRKGGSQRLST